MTMPLYEEALPRAEQVADDDSDSDSSSYDACDELFKQGDILRMLRRLEREDEALREQGRQLEVEREQDDTDNITLNYKDYLQHQEGLYDDYKHVNYQSIDFGVRFGETSYEEVASTPLIIEQDRTVGKGGFVWDAGFVLGESVMNMEEECLLDGKTSIIELGAGTGVTSLMIAHAYPQTTVHLTDLPTLMPLLGKNCRQFDGRATCGVLEWGKPTNGETYDIILGADVVASIYDSSGLAKSIYDLSHEKTVVYMACRERLAGVIDRFLSHMDELFTKVERKEPDSSNHSPNVFILKISGKRVYGTKPVTIVS